jgi:hypothetical protein
VYKNYHKSRDLSTKKSILLQALCLSLVNLAIKEKEIFAQNGKYWSIAALFEKLISRLDLDMNRPDTYNRFVTV